MYYLQYLEFVNDKTHRHFSFLHFKYYTKFGKNLSIQFKNHSQCHLMQLSHTQDFLDNFIIVEKLK